jgi:putative lipoprotein
VSRGDRARRRCRPRAALGVAIATWLVALGCQTAGSAPSAPPFPLGGSAWRVDEIDGRRVQGSNAPTLAFDGAQRVSGSSGCNRYTGALTAAGAGLRVGEVAMTRMACPPAVMEMESRFVTALAAVRGYRLAGDALELVDESRRRRLRLIRG